MENRPVIASARSKAIGTHHRIQKMRDRGHRKMADAHESAYRFTHGFPPAEHAFRLMVQARLGSDRWRPQP